MTLAELRTKFDALWIEIENLRAAAKTAADYKAITAKLDEIDALQTQIDTEERADRISAGRKPAKSPAQTPPKAEPEGGLVVRDGAVVVPGKDNRTTEPWGPVVEESDSKEQRLYKLDVAFGRRLHAVRRASRPGGYVDPRLTEERAAGNPAGGNEAVGAEGGFMVGVDVGAEILAEARETSILYPLTRQIPISAGSNTLKMKGVDETSRVTGSRWGGVQGYWTAEAGSITATKPKWREIILILHKLAALYYSTDELEEDAAALGSVVRQAMAEEFGWLIDNALIRGNGAGQPLGILNSGCLISVAKETGQAGKTIIFENLQNMYARCYAPSRSGASWYINQDVEPQLNALSLGVGTAGVPVYLPAGGLSQAPFATIFGRPVVPIEQCSTLGTVGDIILGNFSRYITVNKGGMEEASSIHVNFLTDETAYRFTIRLDGQPFWHAPLTPANGTNTLSPFVALATRA